MKHVFPLVLLLTGIASQSFSQPLSARGVFESMGKPMMLSGQLGQAHIASKTTAMKHRLSRQDDYNDFGAGNTLTDSTRFIYSGSRGSRYSHSPGGFIDIYNLAFGPTTDFLDVPPNPNSNDSIMLPLVSFDSLAHYHVTAGTSKYAHSEKRGYNNDGSVNAATAISYGSGGTISSGIRQVMAYSGGRMIRVYSLILNGASYDTLDIRMLAYDASGKALLDSTVRKSGGSFQPNTRTIYTYNAAGARLSSTKEVYMPATSSFVPEDRYVHTYLPSGFVGTTTRERAPAPGAALVLAQTDSFGYTPGVPGYTSVFSRSYSSGGTPGPLLKTVTNHFASNGLKDSMTFSDVTNGLDIFSYKLRYNLAGDIDSVWCYDLQVSPAAEVFGTKYFYEPYDDDLGAATESMLANAISVFPNPASSQIFIGLKDGLSGAAFSVRLLNSWGQIVHCGLLNTQGVVKRLALPAALAPGNYFLSVADRQGKVLGVQSFQKL